VELLKSRMTCKGQVTIPAQYRKRLGIKPGDTVVFGCTESGLTLEVRRSRLLEGFGIAGRLPYPLTDEESTEALELGLAEEAESSMNYDRQ
jgi:AbrB family looped-hinge helix DNA binding protein